MHIVRNVSTCVSGVSHFNNACVVDGVLREEVKVRPKKNKFAGTRVYFYVARETENRGGLGTRQASL